MVDKNPYEKDDDVNVPNFGDSEDKGSDPIFNMDTTSISSETDAYTVEEEAESSSKVAIIVLIVFLVLFLGGTVVGLIFGVSKAGEVKTIREEYDAYKEKTTNQINSLETEISTLKVELEAAKANTSSNEGSTTSGSSTTTPADTYYLMDEGVGVRPSAGDTSKYVDYSKLPNDIKDLVFQNGTTITTRNVKFPIYETKQVGTANWGRIADNAWVCIDYGKKQ